MWWLQSEKELQSGGEIKELADAADKLSKRLVKDTTAWTNKKENLESDHATCQQACFCPVAAPAAAPVMVLVSATETLGLPGLASEGSVCVSVCAFKFQDNIPVDMVQAHYNQCSLHQKYYLQ